MMKFATVLALVALLIPSPALAQRKSASAALPTIDVVKSATCGCCSKWVDHMRQAGFTVNVKDLSQEELTKFKQQHGVPLSASSCHTGRVAGYTIEGHIPAWVIKKMLTEKPKIAGLTVPGMPIGSPGMEVAGSPNQTYNVLSFDKDGRTTVYTTIRP